MDVLIIGAGVIGNAIARELSRFRIHVEVLEKEQVWGWQQGLELVLWRAVLVLFLQELQV